MGEYNFLVAGAHTGAFSPQSEIFAGRPHSKYCPQRIGAESLPDEELLALVLRMPQRNGSDVLAKCQMNGWA